MTTAMFSTSLDDEVFSRLIAQIKQRIHAGQDKQEIADHFIGLLGPDTSQKVYLAYHSAAILCKYDTLESK